MSGLIKQAIKSVQKAVRLDRFHVSTGGQSTAQLAVTGDMRLVQTAAMHLYADVYGQPTHDSERLFVQRGVDCAVHYVEQENPAAVRGLAALNHDMNMSRVEDAAVRSYHDVYGRPKNDNECLLIQRGIDTAKAAVHRVVQENRFASTGGRDG